MYLWLLKFKFMASQTSTWQREKMTILNIIKSLENLKYFPISIISFDFVSYFGNIRAKATSSKIMTYPMMLNSVSV